MKIGDLVNIHTYRNSGDIEAIGILLEYNLARARAIVYVNGVQQNLPVGLLTSLRRWHNENR